MSLEENKALLRYAIELWNRRDLDAFFQFLAPDYVEHLPTGDISLEQLRLFAPTFFTAFPDISFTIERMVAEGDMVAALINWRATHKGVYMGIQPTGKSFDITVANIIRIAGGKWAEFWNVTDISLIKQLGVIPSNLTGEINERLRR